MKVIKKSDKYEWHDLRGNKEDLPKNNEHVLVCAKELLNYPNQKYRISYFSARYEKGNKYRNRNFYNDEYESYVIGEDDEDDDVGVLAWKYIEPFDELPVE